MMPESFNYNCPCCEQTRACAAAEKRENFQIVKCLTCGLFFSWPMSAGDSHYYETNTEYGDKWEFDFLAERWKGEARKGKLLDLGCGDGRFLEKLKGTMEASGLDFNPAAAVTAAGRGLEVHTSTLESFLKKFPERKFETVTAFHILEHLENPGAFLEQIKKALVRGGVFAVSVPNPDRWRWNNFRENWDYPPHHLTRWNSSALRSLLEKHGFRVNEVLHEKIKTFAQVKSCFQDIVWSFAVRSFSFGTGKKLDQTDISRSASPDARKTIYGILVRIKSVLIQGMIFIFSCFAYPWLVLKNKEGKSLLVLAEFQS